MINARLFEQKKNIYIDVLKLEQTKFKIKMHTSFK